MYIPLMSSKLLLSKSSVHLSKRIKAKKESQLLIFFLLPQSWWTGEVIDLSVQTHQHMAITVLCYGKSFMCHHTMKGL